jgi:hypothetical protein
MSWILENLQIVVALAAGIAYWLNNMRQARETAREREEAPVDLEEIFGPDFDFGKVEPAATPPPLPRVDDGEILRQQQLQERIRTVRENKAANRSSTEVVRSWQQKKDQPKKADMSPNSIRSRLKVPGEIRKAVIMREILGPPAGLR